MSIKLVKDKQFEYLYIKDAVAYYSSVQEPKKKYNQPLADAKNQSKREYCLTAFITKKDREELEDKVMVNKQIFEVGKDKNKKRKIKYPLETYEEVKGLHGISLSLNELTGAGKPANLVVVDGKGQPLTELVGNGSKVNVKCFGYRNQEGLLNISMQIVQVTDLVPYEGGGGDGTFHDDELGIDYTVGGNKGSSINDEFGDVDDAAEAEGDDGPNEDDF